MDGQKRRGEKGSEGGDARRVDRFNVRHVEDDDGHCVAMRRVGWSSGPARSISERFASMVSETDAQG